MKINFRASTKSLLILLGISYVICIATDVLFGWTMYEVWMPLIPGFTWPPTFTGFFIGLAWIIGYSLYLSALFVLPYNYFAKNQSV